MGRKISALQKKPQWTESQTKNLDGMDDIHKIKVELNKMLLAEEDTWNQRSRNCWLKSGDRNTSFFHSKASNRHQCNTILKIMDSNGEWKEDEEQVGRTFVEYFEKLFASSHPIISEELIDVVPTKVTDRMNSILLQEFQAIEVERALKQMHPLKAPNLMVCLCYSISIFSPLLILLLYKLYWIFLIMG